VSVVRPLGLNRRMIEAEQAAEIEARLAKAAGVTVWELRDYLRSNVRAGANRLTGYKFVRGSHGGTYLADPEGTDILPSRYDVPA
jgi:hypothetical protein